MSQMAGNREASEQAKKTAMFIGHCNGEWFEFY